MRLLSILTSLVVGALARPQRDTTNDTHSQSNTTLTKHPSVTIANGTVIGNYPNGVDSFYGIPSAEPPVGNLRLRRPEPRVSGFPTSTFQATGVATACPQPTTANFSASADLLQGEDCLSVTIQRPTGTNGTSKLPVLFWVSTNPVPHFMNHR